MKLVKKDYIIIILCIAICIIGYIAYCPKLPDNYDIMLNAEIKRLNALNQQAIKEIEKRDLKIENFTTQIDSLQTLKQKIHIEYVSKYKEINNANSNDVVNEFKNIFANTGIK
jgi:hypothetical protein